MAASGDEQKMAAYLDTYIYSVASHEEFLEKRVGVARLLDLKRQATIKEGYH